MFRFTFDSTEELLNTLDIASKRYSEHFDPGNEIDAYCLHIGFQVMNLNGSFEYVSGGYLSIDEDGYPVGFTFKEFEDQFKVEKAIAVDSISGKQKLGQMGMATAPDGGPDAMPDDGAKADDAGGDDGRTVESISADDVGELDADAIDNQAKVSKDAETHEEVPEDEKPV